MTILTGIETKLHIRRGVSDGRRSPDELSHLADEVRQLPVLAGGYGVAAPISVADALLRVEAELWELTCTADVPVTPGTGWAGLVEGLRRAGWGDGVSRHALRALDMLVVVRASGPPPDVAAQQSLLASIGRLLAYLELRTALG